VIAALKPNSVFDQVLRLITVFGISIPIFVTGIFLISILSLKFDLLPAIGGGEGSNVKSHILHLILPAFSCGFLMMASIGSAYQSLPAGCTKKGLCRDGAVQRSKGERRCSKARLAKFPASIDHVSWDLYQHSSRERCFGGSHLHKAGVGRLIVEAIKSGDFPLVQTLLMLYAGSVVVVNLIIDISYSFVDPRIVYK